MIMVRSTSVNATSVAVLVDHLELPEILCTTIGDDTILTIIDTDENRKRVENKFVDVVKKKGNRYGKRKGNFSL